MIYLHLTPTADNHELDDRGAVTWLARQHRSGDVWIGAPYTALPAIWWYANPDASTPVFEATMLPNRKTCGDSGLSRMPRTNCVARLCISGSLTMRPPGSTPRSCQLSVRWDTWSGTGVSASSATP